MDRSRQQPIGIFDSGIGGLTVAKALHEHMPNEQFIYFGDTYHLPYGDKSADAIRYYCIKISKFLLEKNCPCFFKGITQTAPGFPFSCVNLYLKT